MTESWGVVDAVRTVTTPGAGGNGVAWLWAALGLLATNAAKHGALSVPIGQVRVGWQNTEATTEGGGRRLRLRWMEQGGPETRSPAGQGFGTRLIEFATMQELQGEVELTFTPPGLQAEIVFPIA